MRQIKSAPEGAYRIERVGLLVTTKSLNETLGITNIWLKQQFTHK